MAKLSDELLAALPSLSKAVFSQPVDKLSDSKHIIRPVQLKTGLCYQAESFRNNKAYHKNLSEAELLSFVERELDGRYRQVLIVSGAESSQYCLRQKGGYKKSGSGAAVPKPGGAQSHNREKEYILREGEQIPALVDLGVFTQDYKIVRAKYDKYRQINRFIELVEQGLSGWDKEEISLLDFGCGKSYLTFILYYYLAVKRGLKVRIIGYDIKEDVVERCSAIAEKYGYTGLSFQVADVSRDRLSEEPVDVVVTLHACDTATDYALDYAIRHGVRRIFSVPCCQHEVNSSIRRGGELDIFMDHGIIKERMSALLTDAIRSRVLESRGYRVDMIEFIDFEHSPKNIMIRASYDGRCSSAGLGEALALREKYGFEQKLLELQGNDG